MNFSDIIVFTVFLILKSSIVILCSYPYCLPTLPQFHPILRAWLAGCLGRCSEGVGGRGEGAGGWALSGGSSAVQLCPYTTRAPCDRKRSALLISDSEEDHRSQCGKQRQEPEDRNVKYRSVIYTVMCVFAIKLANFTAHASQRSELSQQNVNHAAVTLTSTSQIMRNK